MARRLWQASRVLVIAEEVEDALESGQAVVALESTIIAHGLPYPDNLALARELEAEVREHAAVPATICVIDGQACIGLDEATLETLARGGAGDAAFAKAAMHDLAVHLARGGNAATTVSATSALAAHAGIRVFATGGIGGVHRGDSGDVSADLFSLSSTPVAVVSAGPKAILDLPKTLEALESLAVLVLGFGCDELPAFYSRTSGLALDHRVDSAEEAAHILWNRFERLGQGGVLIANPAPEDVALPRERVEGWIEAALAAASERGVVGKALTPFLLQFLAEHSGGDAVATNCALAKCNARVAAQIAVAYQGVHS